MIIRDALNSDLPAIREIHNVWISTRTITWSEEPMTAEECSSWFASRRADGHPVLVADDGGQVAGYASYGHFRGEGKWPGYRATVEHTVHVRERHWGQGVGRALLEALVERARAAGMHVMVAGIDGENVESIRFHERLGFTEVARMPQTGQKFGRWLDLVLMQRVLDEREAP